LTNKFLIVPEEIKSDMGLEKLSKTEVFGNNPRMLKTSVTEDEIILESFFRISIKRYRYCYPSNLLY
jgi:predicted aspartyl protease